ncbi:LuxR family two component transcriptional regulator [Murinocardiopsis flavida]|uniref:LuxR family two component transcriptional regulator n=1 Tax=Murinocardiopsis flavida TaxID=645275 RepID=A0A2P8D503_9ACTN|nr:response regulator transcription factor [Murinocardiopsis flavida]PSK92295.1 LuxR family two component transcriptional regulator [Murinocardiopsis flavida]
MNGPAPDAAEAAIRVVLADDHAILRRGLASVLAGEPGIEIVGQAADGGHAVRMVAALAPDVVLMDVRMPGVDGIEACAEVIRAAPRTKVLMLTISDEEADLFAALKAGASGYLLKTVAVEALADSVRSVVRGQSFIDPSMATKLIAEFAELAAAGGGAGAQDAGTELTPRENEVLRLVARGLSNRGIAGRLGISDNTVKNHVRSILEKLRLHSRMEAALFAVRNHLFGPE